MSWASTQWTGLQRHIRMYFDSYQTFNVSVLISVPLLALYIYLKQSSYSKKTPPLLAESLYSIVTKFEAGTPIIAVYMEAVRELGPTFQVRMPEFNKHFVVVEPKLVRVILQGDKNTRTKEAEKYKYYKAFESGIFGIPNVFTKKTYGDDLEWVRKGIAPGFSHMSIQKKIDFFCSVLRRANGVLEEYALNDSFFNLSELLTCLTFDALTTALFDIDYNTLTDSESVGHTFLKEANYNIKEFAYRQALNPLRFLMFWDQERRRAYKAKDFVYQFIKKVHSDYTANKTAEEIKSDKSFLGLISKGYVGRVCHTLVFFPEGIRLETGV